MSDHKQVNNIIDANTYQDTKKVHILESFLLSRENETRCAPTDLRDHTVKMRHNINMRPSLFSVQDLRKIAFGCPPIDRNVPKDDIEKEDETNI